MESQVVLPEIKQSEISQPEFKQPDKSKKKKAAGSVKKSIQYNAQDLDQEQKVDVNPVQLNTQNIHLCVCNEKHVNSCRITGTTYLERDKGIVSGANILLYFGHECKVPVYKTNSDQNGRFVIEDIPPGYYTLYAALGSELKYRADSLKVLSGQDVGHSIFFR